MSILTVSNLEKAFGVDLLFTDVTFSIVAGQKMGLVGRNGCGKTTLLRIIMGQETADSGKVFLAAGRRMGYLKQEAPVNPNNTILEEVQLVFEPLREMERKLSALEHNMTLAKTHEEMEAALAAYSKLRDEFEVAGGYRYSGDVTITLERLGFKEKDLEKRIGSCSGGEQTRVALAKIVLSRPDILILDEPTNHLDISATEWLEGFLKNYDGAVILVSHDRYFLDTVTDTIGEIENLHFTSFRGNYSQFWEQKQEQFARQMALYEQQQAELARLDAIIKRNLGADETSSKRRRNIQQRISRMDIVDRPRTDTTAVHARFDADGAGRVGREVVRFDSVAKSYGDRTLFSDINMTIERGERVGLVGPNGSGKTTLVKILLGQEQPTNGVVYFGHNVRISYFSQHAADSLDTSKTVLDTIYDNTEMTTTEARNYLARFLFMGDDVYKIVSMLSGGEKNKLALAQMILEPCNLLVLDEPTNHLDISSCEVLTKMLSQYNGTLLLISHDRYLLNAATTKTLSLLGDSQYAVCEGNYKEWRDAYLAGDPRALPVRKEEKNAPRKKKQPVPDPVPAQPVMTQRELSKARVKARELIERTEAAVTTIEQRIAEVEDLLANPTGSAQEMVALAAEHTRLQDDLLTALSEWEKAIETQDSLGQ